MTDKTLAITDPRMYDGDPYDVAEKSVAQIKGLLEMVDEVLPATRLMVCNAELERQLWNGEEADAIAWEESLVGRKWQGVADQLIALQNELNVLHRAAAYDPRKP